MRLFIILFLFVLSAPVVAIPVSIEYDDMADFLHQISLKKQVVLFAHTGDLNNDGLEDWAGVLIKGVEELSPLIQLIVLTKLPNGHYVESASTREVEDDYLHSPSSSFDFDIRSSSIYFSTTAHTCCDFSGTDYQFKLFNGIWRLIGRKVSSGNMEGESDDYYYKVEDENMLTGLTIITMEHGKSKTIHHNVKKRRVFLLKDFDFSGAYAALP